VLPFPFCGGKASSIQWGRRPPIFGFYRTVGGWKTYIVRGWYLDANGCPKTYGNGYEESFTDETQYLPNRELPQPEVE
jgi:hypothetical protein